MADIVSILKKKHAGDPLTPEEDAFLVQWRKKGDDIVRQFDAEKKALRDGDSARARFYRLKDASLATMPGNRQAVGAYEDAKRKARAIGVEPPHDPDGEALILAFYLLKGAVTLLQDDENDEDVLVAARGVFSLMEGYSRSFVPRWT
jgi:hypothetical protein